MPKPLTKDYILQRLQEEGSKHGFISAHRWEQAGLRPTVFTIRRHFGSWHEAWTAVDIVPKSTPQKIIEAMQAVGIYQTQAQWDLNDRRPCSYTVMQYFDSWKAAWKAAGISGPIFLLPDDPRWEKLTTRQQQVLTYLQEGKSQTEIAKLLGVSKQRIQQSKDHILHRLGQKEMFPLAKTIYDPRLIQADEYQVQQMSTLQRQILTYLREGKSQNEIARMLDRSVYAVNRHRHIMLNRLKREPE